MNFIFELLAQPMDGALKEKIMRHRVSIQDGVFVLSVILLVGFGVYEFDFAGTLDADKRIEFEEMMVLGALIVVSIMYLGWRRVRDQEREITRRIVAERRAHRLAHTDPLTGLANRRHFEATLRAAVNLPRGPNEIHAVFMLDLNGFKLVNDLFGHAEGDDLIVAAAGRLRSATRDNDLVARLGGDEFAIIAYHLAGIEGATNVAMRILKIGKTHPTQDPPAQSGPRHRHRRVPARCGSGGRTPAQSRYRAL